MAIPAERFPEHKPNSSSVSPVGEESQISTPLYSRRILLAAGITTIVGLGYVGNRIFRQSGQVNLAPNTIPATEPITTPTTAYQPPTTLTQAPDTTLQQPPSTQDTTPATTEAPIEVQKIEGNIDPSKIQEIIYEPREDYLAWAKQNPWYGTKVTSLSARPVGGNYNYPYETHHAILHDTSRSDKDTKYYGIHDSLVNSFYTITDGAYIVVQMSGINRGYQILPIKDSAGAYAIVCYMESIFPDGQIGIMPILMGLNHPKLPQSVDGISLDKIIGAHPEFYQTNDKRMNGYNQAPFRGSMIEKWGQEEYGKKLEEVTNTRMTVTLQDPNAMYYLRGMEDNVATEYPELSMVNRETGVSLFPEQMSNIIDAIRNRDSKALEQALQLSPEYLDPNNLPSYMNTGFKTYDDVFKSNLVKPNRTTFTSGTIQDQLSQSR